MKKIAVLGMGAMGSRIARTLLAAGHQIVIWNRTPAAMAALADIGAIAAATPKAAATGADFVMAMVRDDAASREIWLDAEHGALAGMRAGAVAIESSTLTPDWVRELGQHAAAIGVDVLEAPVSGSRTQAETGQLIYLVGGEAAVLERARPLLLDSGSAIHHVGPLGSGALTKLATNALLGIQVTALAEIIAMLRHNGAHVETVLGAVSGTSVWSPVANYLAGSMIAGNFAPQFTIELMEKDFGYAIGAGAPGAAPTIAAARSLFQKAVEAGFGERNMTGVAGLFTPGGAMLE